MQNLSKLNTAEDHFNIHKMLGIYCTLHYIWRYVQLLSYGTMGFQRDSHSSALSMLPHFLLPTTSFFFRVLPKRMMGKTTMIWEEMRLHSVVFSTRSVAIFYFYYFTSTATTTTTTTTTVVGQYNIFCRLAIIFVFHILADIVTRKYGTAGVSTIRVHEDEKHSDPLLHAVTKRFYSWAQMAATAALVIPGEHTLDTSFSILIGIHYAAFLMTLNRKNIISSWNYNIGYFISLLFVSVVLYCRLGLEFYAWSVAVFIVRVNLPPSTINKYLLWILFAIAYHYCHPTLQNSDPVVVSE